MGGYALYVWLAYGCGLLVISVNIIRALKQPRMIKQSLLTYWRKHHEKRT
ncbi:MAG: heme exporter protein CcmD [Legionellales bacterium]|nr:heme exporter protein CcmD [Legionellales bacterium]